MNWILQSLLAQKIAVEIGINNRAEQKINTETDQSRAGQAINNEIDQSRAGQEINNEIDQSRAGQAINLSEINLDEKDLGNQSGGNQSSRQEIDLSQPIPELEKRIEQLEANLVKIRTKRSEITNLLNRLLTNQYRVVDQVTNNQPTKENLLEKDQNEISRSVDSNRLDKRFDQADQTVYQLIVIDQYQQKSDQTDLSQKGNSVSKSKKRSRSQSFTKTNKSSKTPSDQPQSDLIIDQSIDQSTMDKSNKSKSSKKNSGKKDSNKSVLVKSGSSKSKKSQTKFIESSEIKKEARKRSKQPPNQEASNQQASNQKDSNQQPPSQDNKSSIDSQGSIDPAKKTKPKSGQSTKAKPSQKESISDNKTLDQELESLIKEDLNRESFLAAYKEKGLAKTNHLETVGDQPNQSDSETNKKDQSDSVSDSATNKQTESDSVADQPTETYSVTDQPSATNLAIDQSESNQKTTKKSQSDQGSKNEPDILSNQEHKTVDLSADQQKKTTRIKQAITGGVVASKISDKLKVKTSRGEKPSMNQATKNFPVPLANKPINKDVDYLETPASRVGYVSKYLNDRQRFLFAFLFALSWVAFAGILAVPWISDLAETISWPGAIFVILGIAILPGYLTAFLVASVFLDKPRQLVNNGTTWPGVTVLIAAYNEEDYLVKTVYGILESQYQGDIEVIIVDDGSTDNTASIAYQLETISKEFRPGLSVRYFSVDHRGKSYALNFGLNQAKNDLIISLDADTIITKQAIRRIVSRMEIEDSSAVAGAVFTLNSTENILTRLQQWDYQIGIASIKRSQALWRSTLVAQGAFSLYKKDLLVEAGGWPDMIGEDIVLTWNLIDKDHKISFEPTAIAFTTVPNNIRQFIRQRSRWARGMIEGLKSHGPDIALSKKFASHGILINYAFPWIDFSYTFFFIPGLILALTVGNFAVVGPMTLFVLPLNFLVFGLIASIQRKVFREVGIKTRPNKLGLFGYLIFYQFILAPISLFGYIQEFFSHKRKW